MTRFRPRTVPAGRQRHAPGGCSSAAGVRRRSQKRHPNTHFRQDTRVFLVDGDAHGHRALLRSAVGITAMTWAGISQSG